MINKITNIILKIGKSVDIQGATVVLSNILNKLNIIKCILQTQNCIIKAETRQVYLN